MPGLRYVVVPHPIGGIREAAVIDKAHAAVDDLLHAFTAQPSARPGAQPGLATANEAAIERGRPAQLVPLPADMAALRREFVHRGWSDGLPVVLPTPER